MCYPLKNKSEIRRGPEQACVLQGSVEGGEQPMVGVKDQS